MCYLKQYAPYSPLAVALGIVLLSFVVRDARRWSITIRQDFHVSVANGHVVYFNDPQYGPYQGSIVGFEGAKYPLSKGFGYAAGIYYRHFTWPNYVLWTLAVHTFWFFVPASVATGMWLWFRRSGRNPSYMSP
jgi:hypothetical protein